MLIRPAVEADLPAVAAIYDHEVRTGVATFDLEPRPLEAWRTVRAAATTGDHLLVAEDAGAVRGYASSGPYRPKPGYRHTRETTIYLAPEAQGRGVGRRLYDDLLDRLVADGVHLVLAAVALPNEASRSLHRACGFEEVGVMREVGRKHDRWIDVLWLQKRLSDG
jgi:phosphinothricin acetyltransferase